MAKYCSKCGRALPEGVEICPMCHADGSEHKGAALFTQMTAETEIWKEAPKPPKKRVLRKPGAKEKAMLYSLAVVLLAVAAFVIIYSQPGFKVRRAINDGDYDKAFAIFSEKIMDQGKPSEASIGQLLAEKAAEQYSAYEVKTADEETTERVFSGIYAFALNPEGIAPYYKSFTELKETRALMEEAEALILGEYHLKACDLLRTVDSESYEYAAAQARAEECLDMYAAGILSKADLYMGDKEYAAAVKALERGNDQLKVYDTFSPAIDAKLEQCFTDYEAYALEEAERLAGQESYTDAANLIFACMKVVGETEELHGAFDGYSEQAADKTATDAIVRANEFYANGAYADAFLELEAAQRRLEDSTEVDAALEAMEARFVAEMREEAVKILDNTRENVDAALEAIYAAYDIRELDGLREYAEYLESLRPLELVSAEYTERSGVIYRSSTEFKAVNGTTYSDGWIWGGNEVYIGFELDGQYDVFSGTFAIRRDDDHDVSGYFEVLCDGDLIYTAEIMEHDAEPVDFTCEITGCDELKLIFYCDYETSTAEDGFCYHGICSPVVLKNLGE